MMVILIPPILYLLCQRRPPSGVLDLWLFLIPALVFVAFILDLMGKFRILPFIPPTGLEVTGRAMSIAGWALNLYFVIWSAKRIYGKPN